MYNYQSHFTDEEVEAERLSKVGTGIRTQQNTSRGCAFNHYIIQEKNVYLTQFCEAKAFDIASIQAM